MPAPTSPSTDVSGRGSVTVAPGLGRDFETTLVRVPDASTAGDCPEAPPEILRLRSRGVSGDYYQALSTAAAMRLRLLGTLHARSELVGPTVREAARARLAAQQRQAWQQLQWLMAEMHRLDAEA